MATVIQLDRVRESYRRRILPEFWHEQREVPPLPWEHLDWNHSDQADELRGAQWPQYRRHDGLLSLAGAVVVALSGAILLRLTWRR